MNLEMFATVALNGITVAALYFIVAIGFSLIFGLMRSVNMAHGTLFLVGAYAGVAVFYPLYDAGNAYAWIVALVVGMAASAILGVVLQVVFLGWMQGQELRQTLVTIGISIIVADQLLAIFGGLTVSNSTRPTSCLGRCRSRSCKAVSIQPFACFKW